jgi:hypothetical protein
VTESHYYSVRMCSVRRRRQRGRFEIRVRPEAARARREYRVGNVVFVGYRKGDGRLRNKIGSEE